LTLATRQRQSKVIGDGRTRVTLLSDVVPGLVHWLWEGWIPLGALTVLDGDPGLGKSTLVLDIAARLSRGDAMPDGTSGPEPSGTVVLSAEDDLGCVIRPRLDAAGADLNWIATVKRVDDDIERDVVLTADGLRAMEEATPIVSAKLIVIDPLVAYLPGTVDANRDQDVRRALAQLSALAVSTGSAIVAIRHLRKSGGGNPLYRGAGSIGIIGAARSGILLAGDPDDPTRRVLAAFKSNFAATPPSIGLQLAAAPGSPYPVVSWLGPSNQTAESLLAFPEDPEGRGALQEAKDFLREALSAGEAAALSVQQEAGRRGISKRTLDRAKKNLGVQSGRGRENWTWRMPTPGPLPGQDDVPKVANPADLGNLQPSDGAKPMYEAENGQGCQLGHDGNLAANGSAAGIVAPCPDCGGSSTWQHPAGGSPLCSCCHPNPFETLQSGASELPGAGGE
jgi:hypothetical protein